jgi:hypothetical protein
MRDLMQIKWSVRDVLETSLIKGMERDDVSMVFGEFPYDFIKSNVYAKEVSVWLEKR